MENNRGIRGKAKSAGFTRADLAVAIGIAALLAAWFGSSRLGERGRIARCASNLAVLGEAMDSFANDHNDGIPAEAINLDNVKRSWDTDLLPYLKPSLARSKGEYAKRQLLLAVQPLFFCPSDPVQRGGHPRSYAFSARDMACGWPPEAGDKTGVGVFWSKDTVGLLAGEVAGSGGKDLGSLPRLKRPVLPDPAGTMLVTELMALRNTMGSVLDARVFGVNEQEPIFKRAPRLHSGRFNYLMADGHVALLTGLQTGGLGGKESPAGIWTVKAGD